MNGIIRVGVVIALLMSTTLLIVAFSQSPELTRGGQDLYRTQEAHDAVQDTRILNLENAHMIEAALIQDIRDKQEWTLGGVAGFGALIAVLQVLQYRKK